MNITIWQIVPDEKPLAIDATLPVWLTPDGVHSAGTVERPLLHDDGLLLIPAPDGSHTSAALLVPEALQLAVCLNRVPLAAGLYAAVHGDQVTVAEQLFWVARESVPREVTYDPAAMGEDVFCARTKARIKAGDLVVFCPGTPKHACGLIYRREAWAVGVACHACRFDPQAPSWLPPQPAVENKLDELFRYALSRT